MIYRTRPQKIMLPKKGSMNGGSGMSKLKISAVVLPNIINTAQKLGVDIQDILRRQAENIVNQQLTESPLSGGPARDLKRLLATRGDLLHASVKCVAQSLKMSVRTLQRRLAENGQRLTYLRDQIRFQLAVEALRSRRLSIEEIGDKLWFSDRHSFTRAFKSWSGYSPSAYRKHCLL
jgi:AraC-like DNA-binding protein